MFYELLGEHLRKVYTDDLYSSRRSIHEGLKAQLYVTGYRAGLKPILEARVKDGFIDCLLLDGKGNTVVAIEVDHGIKKKSIKKLNSLSQDVEKILVSYCADKFTYYRAKTRRKSELGSIKVFRF